VVAGLPNALAAVRAKTAYLDGELCGVGANGLPRLTETQAATDGRDKHGTPAAPRAQRRCLGPSWPINRAFSSMVTRWETARWSANACQLVLKASYRRRSTRALARPVNGEHNGHSAQIFSPLTLPSSTPSTSIATSLPLQRIAFSPPRRCARGARQSPLLKMSRAAGPSRSFVGNVTRSRAWARYATCASRCA
jgi:hypothetical protein